MTGTRTERRNNSQGDRIRDKAARVIIRDKPPQKGP